MLSSSLVHNLPRNWSAFGAFLLFFALCSCSKTPKPEAPILSLPAHLIDSDGTAVAGAPEPEVVQLKRIETLGTTKYVTVGNVAGEYVLVCNLGANDKEHNSILSCLSPAPLRDYLLFRDNTQWQLKSAKRPMNLKFMQDFSVIYNEKENVGLLPAKSSIDPNEQYGVYWLSSWTEVKGARSSVH